MPGPHLGVIVGEDGQVYREILRVSVAWEKLDWITWAGSQEEERGSGSEVMGTMKEKRYQTRDDSEDDWELVVLNLVRRPSGIVKWEEGGGGGG